MANEIGESQLKFGYWYIKNRMMLKNVLVGILFVVNLAVWSFIVYSLVNVYGINYKNYQQLQLDLLVDRFTNYQESLSATTPKDLQVSDFITLPSGPGKVDIIATIVNPNKSWLAKVQYQFRQASEVTPLRQEFILPGQEKFLVDLDVEAQNVSDIVFKDVSWERANDSSSIILTRELFVFDEVKFTPATPQGDLTGVAVASFKIKNTSNYNYYKPLFQVVLTNNNQIVGFSTLVTDNFLSGQERILETRWFESLPPVSEVKIIPNINYLDPAVYISY